MLSLSVLINLASTGTFFARKRGVCASKVVHNEEQPGCHSRPTRVALHPGRWVVSPSDYGFGGTIHRADGSEFTSPG